MFSVPSCPGHLNLCYYLHVTLLLTLLYTPKDTLYNSPCSKIDTRQLANKDKNKKNKNHKNKNQNQTNPKMAIKQLIKGKTQRR